MVDHIPLAYFLIIRFLSLEPMVKRRHKAPSRIRYEQSHPVISFRIRQDLHDRFKTLLKNRNQSAAEFLGECVDKQENIFSLGRLVTIPCSICGKPMSLDVNVSPGIKETLKEAFNKWCHASCDKKKRDGQLSPTS